MITISARIEHFPITGAFVIARERRTVQTVVYVELDHTGIHAHAECVPYKHYGETAESVLAQIAEVAAHSAPDLAALKPLIDAMPAGAARNGLDCAWWHAHAKTLGQPVWHVLSLPQPKPLTTAYTLSLDTPEAMAAKAAQVASTYPLLKLKLGGAGDEARMHAVRAAAPHAILIADANEAWTAQLMLPLLAAAHTARVALIEQPLPASNDELLRHITRLVPICADESLHTRADLPQLVGKYDAVNIKLDKAGGLTEAVKLLHEARALNFKIMIGCMLATSLAMAPALLLAATADYVDLDGPLLLAQDRPHPLQFNGAQIMPADGGLWG